MAFCKFIYQTTVTKGYGYLFVSSSAPKLLLLTLTITLTLSVNSGAGELTDKYQGTVSTVCKFYAVKHTKTNNN